MISRRVFAGLTTGLLVLAVVSALLFAFQALLASVGDGSAARTLFLIGRVCLGLLALNALLLLGALGYSAMDRPDDGT